MTWFYVWSCSCGSSLVPLQVFSPVQILLIMQATGIAQFFLSLIFLFFFILEFKNLFLSVPSVLFCSFLCSFFVHPSIFYSFFCSLFCSFPLCLFTLFFYLPYCLLLKSAILSFLFSYYVLFVSPLYVLLLFNLLSFCYSSSFQSPLFNTSWLSL